jgi:hypothetical protein
MANADARLRADTMYTAVTDLPPAKRFILTHDDKGKSTVHSSPELKYYGYPGVGGTARSCTLTICFLTICICLTWLDAEKMIVQGKRVLISKQMRRAQHQRRSRAMTMSRATFPSTPLLLSQGETSFLPAAVATLLSVNSGPEWRV